MICLKHMLALAKNPDALAAYKKWRQSRSWSRNQKRRALWCSEKGVSATWMATATRTPQNNRFLMSKNNRSTCAFYMQCCTFICRDLQNNNVKWPNFMFSREREGIFLCFNGVHGNLVAAQFVSIFQVKKKNSIIAKEPNHFEMALLKLPKIKPTKSEAVPIPLMPLSLKIWCSGN